MPSDCAFRFACSRERAESSPSDGASPKPSLRNAVLSPERHWETAIPPSHRGQGSHQFASNMVAASIAARRWSPEQFQAFECELLSSRVSDPKIAEETIAAGEQRPK